MSVRQPGRPTVAQVMRPYEGKTTTRERAMSKKTEKVEQIEIVVELGPGQHVRDDGRIVHTDMSGSFLLDEDGEVEDVVFFASPRYLRELTE